MPGKSSLALNLCHYDSFSCENVGEGNEKQEAEKREEEEPWQRASAMNRRAGNLPGHPPSGWRAVVPGVCGQLGLHFDMGLLCF